jgi:uncharacterized repeat protein (TIGR01451 family)
MPHTHHFMKATQFYLVVCLSSVSWYSNAASFTVANANDSGAGSLRQAILDANANPGLDTIRFALSASPTIRPVFALPATTGFVIIDGTTQPGYSGQPIVELNGIFAGVGVNGLTISGGNSTVRGLVINGFLQNGIRLNGGANNIVEGNFIGTARDGRTAVGNGYGIWVEANTNTRIGGTTPAARNVISGNSGLGVEISVGTTGTRVEGNYIGTDMTGTNALGNGTVGVGIFPGSFNVIGGTAPGAGNVIAANGTGNLFAGIEIDFFESVSNVIEGNYIGTDATGRSALGNAFGILIDTSARNTRIGGTTAAARNIISGNSPLAGVVVRRGPTGTLIQGNFIGTDVTGTNALGNGQGGIFLSGGVSSTQIGGTVAGAGNLISGHSLAAIEINDFATQNNVIEGNLMGTDISGRFSIPNGGGVLIDNSASNNRVGGPTAASRNVIAGNSFQGVIIRGGATANSVQGNFIGTDITGTSRLANNQGGVMLESENNLVGPGNLISGNDLHGMEVRFGAVSNRIEGNFIGTDAYGTNFLGNSALGILFDSGPSNNVVGGTNAAQRNIISGNGLSGIGMEEPNTIGNRVQGNFIGTDVTGTRPLGNGEDGVFVTRGARNNTIGGSTAGSGNLISANGRFGRPNDGRSGIEIWLGATANTVQGNLIGTDVTGTMALPNREYGVFVQGSPTNTIGTPGAGNLISGNGLHGIYIEQNTSSGNNVSGNRIGTDNAGTSALPNGGHGIYILDAPTNSIGGAGTAGKNVISGNTLDGVLIDGPTAIGTRLRNNYIGTDITGTSGLPNGGDGVHIRNGANRSGVGANITSARNVISGNRQHGVHIEHPGSVSNLVQGNFIGTDASGTNALANGGSGIRTSRSARLNTIGGALGARNTIAFNQADGVHFRDGTQNLIRNNSIFSNGLLGINLGLDAVTPNDSGDPDTGANDLQNFPVLQSAVANANGTTTISGRIDSRANTVYVLEFFANPGCDPSGHGEGPIVLGTTNVTTDAIGTATYTITFTNTLAAGGFVSATATDPLFNTSEFSRCVQIVATDGGADMAIRITTAATAVSVGEDVQWQLAVTNFGPGNASSVRVTISLPNGLTLISVTASQGTCSQMSNAVPCDLGVIVNGASAAITVVARVDAVGTSTGSAGVNVASGDPNLENNALDLVVTATERPRLVLQQSKGEWVISWSADMYTLQCATNLNNPVFWQTVTKGIETMGDQSWFVVPTGSGNKFFRLSKE